MYEKVTETKYGSFTTIYPKEGYLLLKDGVTYPSFSPGKNSGITMEDFEEIEDGSYTPPPVVPEDTVDPLLTLKNNQIKLSKLNLSAYLETHPLFSNVKYEEGRYYTVTSEKQQQLTSKMMLNELYKAQGIPYTLTWNDTGNVCEEWTDVELATLSMQVDAYVTPLIKMQQTIEVQIKNATTQEEVLQIDVTYSDKNIQNYINK